MKKILIVSFSLFIFSYSYGQNVLAEHHFESSEVSEVSVIGVFCDVFISKGDKVIFDGRIEGGGDKDDFIIASVKSGDKVLFKVESKSNSWWNDNEIKKARLNISIPDNVVLKIDNTSGDVRVESLSGSDYLIETTSGDINVTELTGTAKIKSTSGDVSIRGAMGDLSVRSTSGDQRVNDVTGSLNIRTTSGDMDITGVDGNLNAGATSGDIEIRRLKGAVFVETTSGDIDAREVLLTGNSGAKATSGDVSFYFVNNLKEIGFDLRATSGDLEVGAVSAEDRLVLQQGSILFSGVTTSGDQEYTD